MKQRSITAVILERILLASMALLIVSSVFGFSAVNGWLRSSAKEANHAKIDADIARSTIDQLRFLDTYVKDNKAAIDRTAAIVSDSKQYLYQNQIIADINAYAARASVSIIGYNFTTTGQKSPRAVAGLKTISASITLDSPLEYTNFLRFLKAIEQNVTKMQITGVSLSPDPQDNNKVSNPTIGLEVYVK